MSDSYEVESIIGHRVVKGKEKFLIKWKGEEESTWEPIENLFGCIEMVREYMLKKENEKKVLDHILGCGQRNGKKYFLVRFKNENENRLIDWETAKKYSTNVMEYFGSRLAWTSVENIIDPHVDDEVDHDDESFQLPSKSKTMPSTSNAPNDIEYEH
ncbi:chromobox protein homolog 1-like [Contarinia nasturtii]|uniref:chromobox protein homolog 1-like n=1 Tax=Contarinia nasturtii TaxID=265458 RepID=UPI0012D465A4|nr:chromobox protein homolog 1-like [Contarinia nasturtii]